MTGEATEPATAGLAAEPVTAGLAADQRATAMRNSIAALMSRSKREIPHYYLSTTVDLQRISEWMRERNRELPVGERLVPSAALLSAAARAAREVPELNGHWVDGGFRPARDVDLGLILSLRSGGLLVPVLAAADTLDISQVMALMRDLTRRARTGRLRGSELSQPSISVSNLGDQGVESVLGVIYPPTGGPDRLRRSDTAPMGGRRAARGTATRDRDTRCGPPRNGRRDRSALAQDHRPDPANPGGTMTPEQARAMLETTIREIVPDADLSTLAPGADLRDAYELDSLDFVELVDKLSTRAGFRIEEDDADGLRSVEAVTQFLVSRSDHVGQQA